MELQKDILNIPSHIFVNINDVKNAVVFVTMTK